MGRLKYFFSISGDNIPSVTIISNDINDCFIFKKYNMWDEEKKREIDAYILFTAAGSSVHDIEYLMQKHAQLAHLLIKHMDHVRMISPSWIQKRLELYYIAIDCKYFRDEIIPEMEEVL